MSLESSHVKIMLKAAHLLFFSFVILIVGMQITGKTKKKKLQRLLAIGCGHISVFQKNYTLYGTVHYNRTLDFICFLFWVFDYCCKQIYLHFALNKNKISISV